MFSTLGNAMSNYAVLILESSDEMDASRTSEYTG